MIAVDIGHRQVRRHRRPQARSVYRSESASADTRQTADALAINIRDDDISQSVAGELPCDDRHRKDSDGGARQQFRKGPQAGGLQQHRHISRLIQVGFIEIGDDDVGPRVSIHVRHGQGSRVKAGCHARTGGESALAIAIEDEDIPGIGLGRLRTVAWRDQGFAVCRSQVQMAIPVDVGDSYLRRHRTNEAIRYDLFEGFSAIEERVEDHRRFSGLGRGILGRSLLGCIDHVREPVVVDVANGDSEMPRIRMCQIGVNERRQRIAEGAVSQPEEDADDRGVYWGRGMIWVVAAEHHKIGAPIPVHVRGVEVDRIDPERNPRLCGERSIPPAEKHRQILGLRVGRKKVDSPVAVDIDALDRHRRYARRCSIPLEEVPFAEATQDADSAVIGIGREEVDVPTGPRDRSDRHGVAAGGEAPGGSE
ncbi:unannotated protein [freshwater metagenome]|uniref:Unannotated protein n=1 Tax=freshwater metagenome TaxID=449393 RepID=A0A6J7M3Q4_9ZZZZ